MNGRLPISYMLGAAGVAAASAYFFDPDRGLRRRHGLIDRARAAATGVQDLARKAGRDIENRAHGVSARAHGAPHARSGRPSLLAPGRPERRLLEGTAGVLTAIWGLARGGVLGAGAVIAGAGLLARAANAEPSGMIRVQKTITIDAPIEEVFQFWADLENLPRFMEHVLDVRGEADGTRSHWRVQGPAGVPIEWDAELTECVENERIGWRVIDGSLVDHEGVVHFERVGPSSTRINVHMLYSPPGGALGHAAAGFLLGDPKSLMDDDFIRLKSLFEDGRTRVAHHRVERPT